MNSINSEDRFVRWHSNLRQQVTFTNNLLLTISIGITGFIFNLLNTENLDLNCCNKQLIKIGLIITIISIILGVLANISRIIDYRFTLKKIKKELEIGTDLTKLKSLKKVFGNITWFLIYSQILSLLSGIIILSFGLFDLYSNKLG
mgnify:CR=1 FL=1